MYNSWAPSDLDGSGNIFETLHLGLKVELIATPRESLKTCFPHEQISDVLRRNVECYDFIPVVDDKAERKQRIIGLFDAASYATNKSAEDRIHDNFSTLSEELLIGADASILDFIKDADEKPCRLVVSGANIVGLVSLSDLQKLPVRAVLFALITGFEITMMDAIRRMYKNELDWMKALSPERQNKVEFQKKKSQEADALVDTLLFTQFADKKTLIRRKLPNTKSKQSFETTLKTIESLRDRVAHANEYASSRAQACNVCKTLRELLQVRTEIVELKV